MMQNRAKAPFTGVRELEAKFLKSLTPEEREIYRKARLEQREEYVKFRKLWSNRTR